MEGNDHSPNIGRDFLYYVNPLTMFGGYDLTVTGRITDEASVFEDDLDW